MVLYPCAANVLWTRVQITGCMVTTLASGNLLFRTYVTSSRAHFVGAEPKRSIAVWNGHRPVVAFLILLEVGHWAMVFAGELIISMQISRRQSFISGSQSPCRP